MILSWTCLDYPFTMLEFGLWITVNEKLQLLVRLFKDQYRCSNHNIKVITKINYRGACIHKKPWSIWTTWYSTLWFQYARVKKRLIIIYQSDLPERHAGVLNWIRIEQEMIWLSDMVCGKGKSKNFRPGVILILFDPWLYCYLSCAKYWFNFDP